MTTGSEEVPGREGSSTPEEQAEMIKGFIEDLRSKQRSANWNALDFRKFCDMSYYDHEIDWLQRDEELGALYAEGGRQAASSDPLSGQ